MNSWFNVLSALKKYKEIPLLFEKISAAKFKMDNDILATGISQKSSTIKETLVDAFLAQ